MTPVFPILVSACLCGITCRYNGLACPHEALVSLHQQGLVCAVCPEMLGGLPVPRPPCECVAGRVRDRAGNDMTKTFAKGAALTLDIAREKSIQTAIFKDKSPSCGSSQVYDGSFSGRLIAGEGVTTALLRANGITVHAAEFLDEGFFSR